MKKYFYEHIEYLTRPGKYPGLDLFRAIAITLVVLFHFNIPYFRMGHFGVDFFFVISGFLIGGMIYDQIQSGVFQLSRFYKNRFLRIIPLYWLFIFLTVINNYGKSGLVNQYEFLKSVLLTLVFMQTAIPYYFDVKILHFVVPDGSWTLCIEEFFYALMPIVLLCMRKLFNIKWLVVALLVVFLAGPFIRLMATSNFMIDDHNWHLASYIQFHSRFDELVIGVVAAILVRNNIKSSMLTVVSIVMLAFCFTYMSSHPVFYNEPEKLTRATIWIPSLISFGIAGLAMAYSSIKLDNKAIILVARLSYPLYLGHIFLQDFFPRFEFFTVVAPSYFGSIHPVSFLQIILSILFAYVLSVSVEYPFIRIYHNKNN